MKHKTILLVIAIAVTALAAAPTALAATLQSSVRIQGATYQVSARTTVSQSSTGGTIVDTDGTQYVTTHATALGALAAALQLGGMPWDMSIGDYGPFINSINGLSAAPDYSNWWSLAVNGYSSPVGAGSLQTVNGDSYLWFQNPDPTFSRQAVLLVNRVTGGTTKFGFTPGQTVNIATVAENLAKVHTLADEKRFSTTDIQLPSQYPAVSGATLHIGSRVYSNAAANVTVKDLAPGTYAVWSEEPMTASTVFVRSQTMLINVGPKPAFGTLTAWRINPSTMALRFALSEGSRLAVSATSGTRQLVKYSGTRAAGLQTLFLHFRTTAPLTSSVIVKITAVDGWGRTTVQNIIIAKGH